MSGLTQWLSFRVELSIVDSSSMTWEFVEQLSGSRFPYHNGPVTAPSSYPLASFVPTRF